MTHYAFYPTTGGVESHLLDLCKGLVKQGQGVHVLVGSLLGHPDEEIIEGIKVYRSDLMNPEWVRDEKAKKNIAADEEDPSVTAAIRKMYEQFIADHKIDVVHGHNFHHFVPEHALALTQLWEKGVPNVLTVHEVWSEFICEDLLKRAKWDTIITFCNHVTKGIREQAPHLENIEVIYPGIDVKQFSPDNIDSKWSDELGLEGRPVIIHPARMLPWKGVIYSVKAMQLILKQVPDALLIITDTEDIVDWIRELQGYKEEVLQLIRSLGLSKSIITQPFPYLELPWVYNCCDVVVYPTIGEEPFGLVPVEGMACAKPVVVTPSGGMTESVAADETGFFVEKRNAQQLADKIVLLLKDKKLALHMGMKGRMRAVDMFSLERMTHDTVGVYERAIRKHKQTADAQNNTKGGAS
ncbi:MAG: glycosyltransferase family 4 protein [Chitinivibrionia bacterium]|nr:glycosyltransferase family 4 protein [Chitinivibrionia bacterium]